MSSLPCLQSSKSASQCETIDNVKEDVVPCQANLTYVRRATMLTAMRMPCVSLPRARRPAAAWALATFVSSVAVTWMIAAQTQVPSVLRQAVTLAPRLMLLGFLSAMVRMVTRLDELQRRIALESVFIAFVGSLALVFVFSGLGESGLWQPRLGLISPGMMAIWAVGYAYSSRKYR